MEQKGQILVTGGAGYIGSHTVIQLIEAGYEAVILDDFSNSRPFIPQQIEKITGVLPMVIEGNCADKQLLDRIFTEFSIKGIIHFAAFKAVGESVADPLSYYGNNLGGLIALLAAMQRHGVTDFVFSSSCTVYGNPENEKCVSETTPLAPPTSPYGWTKWMGEQIIRDAVQANPSLNAVLLRYFNPVGAHESGLIGEMPQGTPNNILPYITQTASGKLEQLTVFGNDYATSDGTCIRDYIHVVDLADAHISALKYLGQNGGLSVFNVGTGKGTSVLELIGAFENASGKKLNWKFGPRRAGDVEEIYASVDFAHEQLRWKARRTVADAVNDSWKWEQKRPADEMA